MRKDKTGAKVVCPDKPNSQIGRWTIVTFALLLGCHTLQAQSQHTLPYKVIVLGNMADIAEPSHYFGQLKTYFQSEKAPFAIIAAGDLLDHGMTSDSYKADSLGLAALISLVEDQPQRKLVILQGDRDWNHSRKQGWKNTRTLEALVKSFHQKNVYWVGNGGCPGPEDILLDERVMLLAFNTQWWNHPEDKPRLIDADCKIATEEDFMEEIEDLVHESGNRNVLIAGHFPLHSLGMFGGKFPVKNHLLPFPLAGSFISAYHQHIGNSEDIVNQNFDGFRQQMDDMINANGQLFYLSGHEQNLQILRRGEAYHINSGSPSKARYAAKSKSALYTNAQAGLVELLFHEDGSVLANILAYEPQKGFEHLQYIPLLASPCKENLTSDILQNENFIPCLEEVQVRQSMSGSYATATSSIAGAEYQAGAVKSLFLGKHYRSTWTQEVTVPYLDLDTTFGGLTPIETGGGRQTSSLRFRAADGNEYTFRSVNKNPEKALSLELRNTVVATIFRDQTTTQHPYGAIGVDGMMNRLGILHAHPRLYVMPDDEKLGPFRRKYGNMLGMLEINPKSRKDGEANFGKADEIIKSHQLFRALYQDHDHQVDQQAYANARLFDMLVGDWSKHSENWKWAAYDQDKKRVYLPIPRDRDHVFSLWDGVLPWLSAREWTNTNWENFDFNVPDVRSLTYQSRHLDRFIATELTLEDWLNTARYIQEKLSDSVIHASIALMPEETYELSGKVIEQKLRARRDNLVEITTQYYQLLARQVDVVGSQKEEYFEVERNAGGSVEVSMYDEKKSGEKELLYQRTFYPKETEEIRVFGLGNEDTFIIKGESTTSMLIRIIGGEGKDAVIDSSEVKGKKHHTLIYEKSEKGELYLGREARRVKAHNEDAYDYDPTGFHYNTYLPLIYPAYNSNDGFSIAAGVNLKRYCYDKQPFNSTHQIGAKITTQGFFKLAYEASFPQTTGQWSTLLRGVYGSPDEDYIFFYGIGNETQKDEERYDDNFYRTRYNTLQLSAGVQKDFWKVSSFSASLGYETDKARLEDNTILEGLDVLGTDRLQFIHTQLQLDLDFRDSPALPQQGTRLLLKHENGWVNEQGFSSYGINSATIEMYYTAYLKWPVTLAVRAGGADSYGKVPFFKLPSLGQNENLRGYFINRFTGESSLYLNTELRVELGTLQTAFLPFTIGTKGFYDTGRVYFSAERSRKWHQGYGFGLYATPLKKNYTINFSLAFSEEESALLMFSIGSIFR